MTPRTPPNTSDQSRYAIVRAATRRARRMLYRGGTPLIATSSRKPEAIAVQEVSSGACPFVVLRKSLTYVVDTDQEPAVA